MFSRCDSAFETRDCAGICLYLVVERAGASVFSVLSVIARRKNRAVMQWNADMWFSLTTFAI